MILINSGITRKVFLIRNYAIKIPRMRCYIHFLQGLLANCNEKITWRTINKYTPEKAHLLCPVIFGSWAGFVLIMKRAEPIKEFPTDNTLAEIIKAGLTGDDKPDNYGRLNGRIVKIDYGH